MEFAADRAGIKSYRVKIKRAKIFLEMFRLEKKRNRYVGELSQGEQKKTFIAMELLSLRNHLFFNDPMKNLDESSIRRFEAFLNLLSIEK